MLSSLTHSYFMKGRKCRSAFKHGADWITWVTIFLYRFCLRGFKPWFLKQSLWRWPQNTMTDQRLFQYIIFIHKFINFSFFKKNFSSNRLPHSVKIKYPFIFDFIYQNMPSKLWINHLYINNCKKMIWFLRVTGNFKN